MSDGKAVDACRKLVKMFDEHNMTAYEETVREILNEFFEDRCKECFRPHPETGYCTCWNDE